LEAYRPWYSPRGASIEAIIGAWIDEKYKHSHSEQTRKKYAATMQEFRSILQARGLDVLFDGPARGLDFVGTIADAAQVYIGWRSPESRHKGEPSVNTQAQRLHILSSFYKFAIRRRHLAEANPIDTVDVPHVEAYANSRAIPQQEIERHLAEINPFHQEGAQALALLAVLLSTGRRVSEVQRMKRRDLVIAGDTITVNFPHTKGGKTISDTLTPEVSLLLARWLMMFYKNFEAIAPDAPIWVNIYHDMTRGEPLGYHGIANVCQRYLGTAKVHTIRHSFAALMRKAGADIKDIQHRLGHSSSATTDRYVSGLESDQNPYAGQLTKLLGLNKRL
jgi:site-specific recombinase XerD